ncbi:hypothetical protein HanRHA438_Chr11g0531001 [Helianthus annuus]|nr:hypothetical protein HanRHA438_Chr11g0531001 [Helianthus annuus]
MMHIGGHDAVDRLQVDDHSWTRQIERLENLLGLLVEKSHDCRVREGLNPPPLPPAQRYP